MNGARRSMGAEAVPASLAIAGHQVSGRTNLSDAVSLRGLAAEQGQRLATVQKHEVRVGRDLISWMLAALNAR